MMTSTETPITLEQQVDLMKKYVLFRQRAKMRNFYCMPDISEQVDTENFCFPM